ncbi:YkvA family protein [Pseudomonas sp.]|uniref:YkvA family protein n=1 Tax=Pseudomonas sp. TaxID=306 RepID=UPI003D0C8215
MSRFMARLQGWAGVLKRDVMALWFCTRHPATPWWLRLLTLAIVAYALSPIDLIPDFIPVLGYLDDLLLLPLGIWLVLRLMPTRVLAESRDQARAWEARRAARPTSRAGAVAIVLIWLLGAALAGYWLLGRERP